MDKKVRDLKKTMDKSKKFNKENPLIVWNSEQSKEMHGNDYCTDFHFFIKYRNPRNILDKIDSIFDKRNFKSPIDKKERLKGHIEETVNDYLLVTYTTSRAPEEISFGWTNIPVIFDKNLSDNYKKYGNIEDYVLKFIQ